MQGGGLAAEGARTGLCLVSVSSWVRLHSRRLLEVEEMCSAEGYWVFSLPLKGCLKVLRSKHTLQFTFNGDGSLGSSTWGVMFMETGNH